MDIFWCNNKFRPASPSSCESLPHLSFYTARWDRCAVPRACSPRTPLVLQQSRPIHGSLSCPVLRCPAPWPPPQPIGLPTLLLPLCFLSPSLMRALPPPLFSLFVVLAHRRGWRQMRGRSGPVVFTAATLPWR
jgi:hypothetical protein